MRRFQVCVLTLLSLSLVALGCDRQPAAPPTPSSSSKPVESGKDTESGKDVVKVAKTAGAQTPKTPAPAKSTPEPNESSGSAAATAPTTETPVASANAGTDATGTAKIAASEDSANPFAKAAAKAKELREAYSAALTLIESGDTKGAHAQLDKVLASQPHHAAALNKKIELCIGEKNYDAALSSIEGALAKRSSASLKMLKAKVLLAKGEHGPALQLVDELLGDDKNPQGRILRAKILARQGKSDAALEEIRASVAAGYRNAEALAKAPELQSLAENDAFKEIVAQLREWRGSLTSPEAVDALLAKHREQLQAEKEASSLPEARTTPDGEQLRNRMNLRLQRGHGDETFFDTTDLRGAPLRSPDLIGKPALVLLWGPWSQKSRQQLPILQAASDALPPGEIAVVTLAYRLRGTAEATRADIESFLRQEGIRLPTGMVERDQLEEIGQETVPCLLFVAANGRVYLNTPGILRADVIRVLAHDLLRNEPEPTDVKYIERRNAEKAARRAKQK